MKNTDRAKAAFPASSSDSPIALPRAINLAAASFKSPLFPAAVAVLQLLYTESTRSSGFLLKKKPSCTALDSARVLENRSRRCRGGVPHHWVGEGGKSTISRTKSCIYIVMEGRPSDFFAFFAGETVEPLPTPTKQRSSSSQPHRSTQSEVSRIREGTSNSNKINELEITVSQPHKLCSCETVGLPALD